MANVSYTRVTWEDSPSTNTPLNASNLNKMDKGVSDCATAINAANSAISGKQPITDYTLNTTSKTVPGSINELNTNKADKTNTVRYYGGNMEYWNGSSWVTVQIGGNMPELDFANAHEITNTDYTTTKAGAIIGYIRFAGSDDLLIGGVAYACNPTTGQSGNVSIQFVPSGTTIKLAQANTGKLHFVPYVS